MTALLGLAVLGGLFRRKRDQDSLPGDSLLALPAGHGVDAAGLPVPRSPAEYGTRFRGDLRFGGSSAYPSGLFVEGSLTIEEGGVVEGEVEVRGSVQLGRNAVIDRPLLVHGGLVLGPGARVAACRVEGPVTLGPGAVVDGPLDCDVLLIEEGAFPAAPASVVTAVPQPSP